MKNQPDQPLKNSLIEIEDSLEQDFSKDQANKLPEISDEELALILISML